MTDQFDSLTTLIARVLDTPRTGPRRVVAIAGAPASGKSTLAEDLVGSLNEANCKSQLVPMDGFHLDNRILIARGMLHRKGAPDTFDAGGLLRLVQELGTDRDLYYPVFDRSQDIAIAGAGYIDAACDTVVIEGNYLLMDRPIWRDMSRYWDMSARLDVPEATIRERLIQRWLSYDLTPDQAQKRAEENDLPNARLIASTALDATLVI